MFKKILVPLDGSELAETALETALALAKNCGAELLLLRVPLVEQVLAPAATVFDTYHLEMSFENSTKAAHSYFGNLISQLEAGDAIIRPLVAPGKPAEVIQKTAELEGIDLIVMTSNGRSGWRKWVMGSVARDVLSKVTVPILLLRQSGEIKDMLIALDGSELAETVLEPAMQLAELTDAKVTLLRVEEAFTYVEAQALAQASYVQPVTPPVTAVRRSDTAKVDVYLDELATEYRDKGFKVEIASVIGDPGPHIVNTAKAGETDVVVMATHGHSGLKKYVYGSVTEHVLNKHDGAMLIVRPQ